MSDQPIIDLGHGGYEYCQNCGYEHLVYTREELEELAKHAVHNSNGGALCPRCNEPNDFCNYFDG